MEASNNLGEKKNCESFCMFFLCVISSRAGTFRGEFSLRCVILYYLFWISLLHWISLKHLIKLFLETFGPATISVRIRFRKTFDIQFISPYVTLLYLRCVDLIYFIYIIGIFLQFFIHDLIFVSKYALNLHNR